MAKTSNAFPVGLYGALLLALCALTVPMAFAPVERTLLGGAALLGRFVAAFGGAPAAAADGDADQARAHTARLAARLATHSVQAAPATLAARRVAVPCTVVAVGGRGGGGGEPCELRLDRTYAELADCLPIVTQGASFLGHLPLPGGPGAPDDELDDFARVLLPNHPLAPSLHTEVETAPGASLRIVVRAASPADPAPLRVDLWDDPYQAARLERAFLPVRTRAVPGSASTAPAGLRIGSTRIWGYPRTESSEALTLGVFVAPDHLPQAISHVIAWRDKDADGVGAERRRAVPERPAALHVMPGAAHGRHLLVADAAVPDGAAVLRDGRLLGVAKPLAGGAALVTSFGASRQEWNLVLLPDEPEAAPRELLGAVVGADGDVVRLRCRARDNRAPMPTSGQLFTGSNGPACPPGVWIGPASGDPGDFDALVVRVATPAGACTVRYCGVEAAP